MYLLSVSVIAAASIGYELLLMRLMSIIQWHHFAYMIISLALLGFGASGTFLIFSKTMAFTKTAFFTLVIGYFFFNFINSLFLFNTKNPFQSSRSSLVRSSIYLSEHQLPSIDDSFFLFGNICRNGFYHIW